MPGIVRLDFIFHFHFSEAERQHSELPKQTVISFWDSIEVYLYTDRNHTKILNVSVWFQTSPENASLHKQGCYLLPEWCFLMLPLLESLHYVLYSHWISEIQFADQQFYNLWSVFQHERDSVCPSGCCGWLTSLFDLSHHLLPIPMLPLNQRHQKTLSLFPIPLIFFLDDVKSEVILWKNSFDR